MALVMSTDLDNVKVQAFGNWFEFKPGQIKNMQDNLAHYLVTTKSYLGFVAMSDNVVENPTSPEAKKEKEDGIRRGREAIKIHLNRIIQNLEVSLQKDLDMANMKISATKLATDGEIEAYKRLAALNGALDDESDKRAAEIAKLKEKINGSSAKSDSATPAARSKDSA